MTEQIENGTLKLICDVPFLKKTKDELTSIFTQKFIEDVTNGYGYYWHIESTKKETCIT